MFIKPEQARNAAMSQRALASSTKEAIKNRIMTARVK
jgi:hypothetical protein